jgi:hypothetical protein
MNINSHNYEAYLLDLIEGRLRADEQRLLKAFIDSHPEYGKWEDFSTPLPTLEAEAVTMPYKEKLLMPEAAETAVVNANNFDHFAIAWHEGLLNQADKRALEQFMAQNPGYQKAFAQYGKVYLKADESVLFPGKQALIQRQKTVPFFAFTRNMAVAASILLLFGMGLWWLMQDRPAQRMTSLPQLSALSATSLEAPAIMPKSELLSKPEKVVVSAAIPEEVVLPAQRFEPLESLAMNQTASIGWTPAMALLYDDNIQNMYYFFDGAALLAALQTEQEPSQKSVMGRIFANLTNKAKNNLQLSDPENLAQTKENADGKPGISLWKVAEAGVRTYNVLTDKQVELKKITDSNGKIQAVRFDSESIDLTRTLKSRRTLSASEN